MTAVRYPLLVKNYEWQRLHPNDKPAVTVGEETRVTQMTDPHYWSESGTDYTLLVTKLVKRRFHTIREDPDLADYIAENTTAPDS